MGHAELGGQARVGTEGERAAGPEALGAAPQGRRRSGWPRPPRRPAGASAAARGRCEPSGRGSRTILRRGNSLAQGESDERRGAPLRPLPVVAGPQAVDEPGLDHRRLQRRARDLVTDGDRLPQEVADLAAVVAREVRAHPLAQVGRLAHVERHPPPVHEPVDAGRAGQRGGQAELGGLGVAGQPGQDEQVVEAEHAPGRRPLEQQVQQVGGGQRVLQRPVGRAVVEPEALRRACPAGSSGTSSRTSRRASAAVSTKGWPAGPSRRRCRAALRKPMSKRTLWPTSTVPPTNSTRAGSTACDAGARR